MERKSRKWNAILRDGIPKSRDLEVTLATLCANIPGAKVVRINPWKGAVEFTVEGKQVFDLAYRVRSSGYGVNVYAKSDMAVGDFCLVAEKLIVVAIAPVPAGAWVCNTLQGDDNHAHSKCVITSPYSGLSCGEEIYHSAYETRQRRKMRAERSQAETQVRPTSS